MPTAPVDPSRLDLVVKAYDIRGTVPDQLDTDLAGAFGAAFARFVAADEGSTRVVVARDMRPSGPELVDAFVAGITGQGLDVVDIGAAYDDTSRPLRLTWGIVEGPPGYDPYPKPSCN